MMDKEKTMNLSEEEKDEEIETEDTEEEKSLWESLVEAVHEEHKDSGKYDHLAKMADEEYPESGYGCILRSIAKEERTHLRHLQAIIADMEASVRK